MIKGIGASTGIAIGKAFVVPSWEWEFSSDVVDVADLAKEYERLYNGIRSSKDELESIKNDIVEVVGKESSQIFDVHLAILEDPVFMNEIESIIERQYKAAEVAVKEVIDKFVQMFDVIDDDYMKERALDIKDVGNRLLKHLLGESQQSIPSSDEPFILVTKELTPSQLAHLSPNQLLGIVTMLGGTHSHTAIMSRAMSIPFVLGLEGKLIRPIHSGDMLIVDGDEGKVFVNPDAETIAVYRERKKEWEHVREELQQLSHVPTVTRDGRSIHLAANINASGEAKTALQVGAAGVGLFRTEVLFMDRDALPNEEEQYAVYKEAAERLGGLPLVVRTLDVGGDKHLDYLQLHKEENPFLGYRAIRISLDRHDLFKTQLRAILRASAHGNVKLMYPMISAVHELRLANKLLAEAKAELHSEGVPFNANLEVGVMIEVPSAAIIADVLAKEVSFFSIGTNDLVQYVLAVDRMNEKVAHLYEPYHPAVIRLLRMIVDAARGAGISVSVCGELAGDPNALPIWLGLGITELSVSVQSVLQVKKHLIESDAGECEQLLGAIEQCETSEAIRGLLTNAAHNRLIV